MGEQPATVTPRRLEKTGRVWAHWTETGIQTYTEVVDEEGEVSILQGRAVFHTVAIEGATRVEPRVYFGRVPPPHPELGDAESPH